MKPFSFLRDKWQNLFNVTYDILLYDLTSAYFECDPPEDGIRKFRYSRDKRLDCVQVVIALIVTPGGFPLAYEVMPGNTKDSNTLEDFLKKIEGQLLDVYLPTTNGKQLVLTRYTQPANEHKMLLSQMKLNLPKQPPPKITSHRETIVK